MTIFGPSALTICVVCMVYLQAQSSKKRIERGIKFCRFNAFPFLPLWARAGSKIFRSNVYAVVQHKDEQKNSKVSYSSVLYVQHGKIKHFGKVFNCPNIHFSLTSGPMHPAFGWSHHPLAIFDLTSLWSLRMWSMVDSSVMPRPVTSFLKGSRWYGHWSPRPWFRIII